MTSTDFDGFGYVPYVIRTGHPKTATFLSGLEKVV
jgi:hypothetical protein